MAEERMKETLNIYVSRLISFNNMAPNLLHNKTETAYLAWFERLERYDRRSLYLYLCAHADELTDNEKAIAERKFKRPVSKEFAVHENEN